LGGDDVAWKLSLLMFKWGSLQTTPTDSLQTTECDKICIMLEVTDKNAPFKWNAYSQQFRNILSQTNSNKDIENFDGLYI
jgi:hypothetical protein